MEAYTEHLAREVEPFNIRVALLEPGIVKTNLTGNGQETTRRLAHYEPWRSRALDAARRYERQGSEPRLVAETVLAAIQSPSQTLRHTVGTQGTWVPRLRRFFPSRLFERTMRKTFDIADMR